MKITFWGAAREVTGSCMELMFNGTRALVDCGMRQGKDHSGGQELFPFIPAEIEYLFLTHAHIDHSGMIPRLVREGFKGKIITTPATADLVEVMLYDSAHIQEKDAEWMTRKSFRTGQDKTYYPLYTVKDVDAAMGLFSVIDYNRENTIGKSRYRFTDAGHILGSGSLELHYSESERAKTIIFSGDIGKKGNPIINDPVHAAYADYVVMESTYGDRCHKDMGESINELIDAIESALRKGGNVIIPSFAVGRTQDLLYIMNKLVRDGRLRPIDVYIDSPLAEKATKIYLSHPEVYDQEASDMFKAKMASALRLHFVHTIQESQKLNSIRSGVVIIAGSGMCEGGRIRHHLKHNLWRPECSLIFVGFQAEGTLGRKIVDGASKVNVLGEEIAARARVYTIGGFSAHGDRKELLEWLGLFLGKPEVFIDHGEEKTALDFEKAVQEKFGFLTHVPHKGESFSI